jgi:O-methyltransferase
VSFTLSRDADTWAVKLGRRLPKPVSRKLRPLYLKISKGPDPSITPIAIPPRRPLGPDPVFVSAPPHGRHSLQVWPKPPPADYLGQLEPEFQQVLASQWGGVQLADCYFYHRILLKDGRGIEGTWNLIGGEDDYLGGARVEGRRVLELGPATGWLTNWMERRGATVVGFDVGWDLCQDMIPLPHHSPDELRSSAVFGACVTQNSWWYVHRELGLSAKAVYGSIYDLPRDIGRYDVAVFGSILLHLRDPFRALEQAAQRTDEAIVVVEPLTPDLIGHGTVARWNPTGGANATGWWNHSPSVVVSMLGVLGFPKATISYHQHPYRADDSDGPPVDVPSFTVVARR